MQTVNSTGHTIQQVLHCFIYFVLFPSPPTFSPKSIILTDDVDDHDDEGVMAFLVTQCITRSIH